jgi:EmrB/QacA subfamily drug resistance transporter
MTPRQKTLALLTLIIALVLEIVDLTIVNTALPAIKSDVGANAEASQWIVAGYALSFALFLMAGGRMGDSFGYRRMFLIGVGGFTLASLGCGMANTAEQLVAARLLQGATGAIMAPQFMALLQVLFDPLERVSKLALFGVLGGIAAIAGPIIGGVLIEANVLDLGWRIVFLINLPIGAAAIVAGLVFLPETRSERPAGYDLIGTILFGSAVAAAIWPLMRAHAGWGWAEGLSLVLSPLLFLLGWRYVSAQAASRRPALFHPALFEIASFRIGLTVAAAFSAASAGFLLVFAFALQSERGMTPLATGLLHMPFGFGAMFGIGVLGRTFLPRYGRWVLVAGALLMAASSAVTLAGIGLLDWNWPALTLPLLVAGIGMGMISGCVPPVTVAQVDRNDAGAASALLRTCQQLGNALGIALAGSVYFAALSKAPSGAALMVISAMLMLCAALAARLPSGIFAARSKSVESPA